jgi:glycosyltransferase involved in cell wall biosynthesis
VTSAPPVGIVIPAFNAARFLLATLESVRDQEYRNLLCCVVDDGSTDATPAIAAEFCATDDRFSTVSISNTGQSTANNLGFDRLADQVRYVCYLDSDDLLRPDAITRLVAAAESDPDCVGSHGVAEYIDAAGAPMPEVHFEEWGRGREDFGPEGLRLLSADEPTTFACLALDDRMIPPGCALIRTSAQRRVGGYDPALADWPDWELFLRLARHGNFAFVDQVVVDYRRHDANLSNRPGFLATANIIRVRTHDSLDNTPTQQRACRRAWRVAQRRYARRCRQLAWAALVGGSVTEVLRQLAHGALARARQIAGRPTDFLLDRRHVTPPATGAEHAPVRVGAAGGGVGSNLADSERKSALLPR